jgi:hypothetical protein
VAARGVYNVLLAPESADVGLTARWVDVVVHVALARRWLASRRALRPAQIIP